MKKKNDIVGDQKFEKLLKDKMNELSSSVDCFDKISARAFPENNSDFSDSEYIVSDLENVTGKRKTVPVLKWTAVAAAIVLFVGVLPRTAFVQEFLSNIGKDVDNEYRDILAEISRETDEHTYKIYDMPLEEYIKKDVLITPYYSCPFSSREKDEINVRIYVRTLFDDIPTNQIYAVEYAGEYKEKNILAAAESEAKFTDEELNSIDLDNGFYNSDEEIQTAIRRCFTSSKTDAVKDRDKNTVFLSSYSGNMLFKLNNDILALTTNVIYNKIAGDDSGKYYYDIKSYQYNNGIKSDVLVPASEKLWKSSLNFDDSSAMPRANNSLFMRKDYFSADNVKSESNAPSYYIPYSNAGESILKDGTDHLEIDYKPNGDYQFDAFETIDYGEGFTLNSSADSDFKSYSDDEYDHVSSFDLDAPADVIAKKSMRIYISAICFLMYSSYSDPTINIRINDTNDVIKIHRGDIGYNTQDLEDASDEQEKGIYDQNETLIEEEMKRKAAEIESLIQADIEDQAKEAQKRNDEMKNND